MTTLILDKNLDKKELRKEALKKRKEMDERGLISLASSKITASIFYSADFINAKHIALYYPIKNEIDLRRVLKVKGKAFYLPRCSENELEFVKFENEESLIEGRFGILEPIGEAINPDILDIIYVPALLANHGNYRLGYGKGFYDRFFTKHKGLKARKVIVVAKEFITNDFIQDDLDIQCDYIIS